MWGECYSFVTMINEVEYKEAHREAFKLFKKYWEDRSPKRAKYLWEEHRGNCVGMYNMYRGFTNIKVNVRGYVFEISGYMLNRLAKEHNWE